MIETCGKLLWRRAHYNTLSILALWVQHALYRTPVIFCVFSFGNVPSQWHTEFHILLAHLWSCRVSQPGVKRAWNSKGCFHTCIEFVPALGYGLFDREQVFVSLLIWLFYLWLLHTHHITITTNDILGWSLCYNYCYTTSSSSPVVPGDTQNKYSHTYTHKRPILAISSRTHILIHDIVTPPQVTCTHAFAQHNKQRTL